MQIIEIGVKRSCHSSCTRTVIFVTALVMFHLSIIPGHGQSRVIAWGAGTKINKADGNDYGQSIVPQSLTNAILVEGGWRHSLALASNGSLVGWGDNSLGETNFFPVERNVHLAIACGYLHSLALHSNGFVSAAGDDFYGQTDVPVNLTNVVAIACGFYHNLALKADGRVTAWGGNTVPQGTAPNYGQSAVPAGISNSVSVSGGAYHSLILREDGNVFAWGSNAAGQTNIPAGLSNVIAIAAGGFHNLALRAEGTIVAWGLNNYGQTDVPTGLSNVVAIAAGGWHSLALKSDGTVVAWGAGIGFNTNVDCGQTVVPPSLTNVIQIAAGTLHSLALVSIHPPPKTALWSGVAFNETNGFTASLPTQNGKVYHFEYKDSLKSPAWIGLGLTAGNGGPAQFHDPTTSAARYYRVTVW